MATNIPRTVWRDTSGLTDYGFDGPYNIDDNTGTFLVDPSAVFIVDTGVTANGVPQTIWSEDDGQ